MKKRIFSLLTALLLPLAVQAQTTAQTEKLTKSVSSLQRMIQLIRLKKDPAAAHLSVRMPVQIPRGLVWGLGMAEEEKPLPPEVEAQAKRMQALTENDSCALILPKEEDVHLGDEDLKAGVTVFKVTMSGKACPIAMEVSLKAKKTDNHIEAEYDLNFEALSPEFKVETDVIKARQTGLIGIDLAQGASGQSLGLKATISGSGLSQTYGDFSMGQDMDMKMNFNFPMDLKLDFVTENSFQVGGTDLRLTSHAKMDSVFSGTEKYYFGGQEITKDVYEETLQGMQFVGVNEKPVTETSPLSCEFRVLDKNRKILQSISACQQEVSQEGNYRGQSMNLSLSFKKNWVEAKFVQNKSEKIIYSLYDEESNFEKIFGDFVLQSECKPAACP